jgi:hypothetical protein
MSTEDRFREYVEAFQASGAYGRWTNYFRRTRGDSAPAPATGRRAATINRFRELLTQA